VRKRSFIHTSCASGAARRTYSEIDSVSKYFHGAERSETGKVMPNVFATSLLVRRSRIVPDMSGWVSVFETEEQERAYVLSATPFGGQSTEAMIEMKSKLEGGEVLYCSVAPAQRQPHDLISRSSENKTDIQSPAERFSTSRCV